LRFASLGGFGAALACAAFLVACGGGGGSAPTSGSLTGGSMNGNHAASNQGPGTHITVVIHRDNTKTHTHSHLRRVATSKRNPKFVSENAEGLQITVAATGAASQSVYADLTSSSLCNTVSSVTTCVITVPTIATNEQFTLLETDSVPQNSTNGYGTGFSNGTNILGALNASESVQLGAANNLALEVGPVAANLYDCYYGLIDNGVPNALPQPHNSNYGIDTSNSTRLVVTGGAAANGVIAVEYGDASGCWFNGDTTPAPFVDVNGSPTPISVGSSSTALTVAPIVNNGTAPPASAYTQTNSIPNDGYYWYDCEFLIGIKTSASFASASTITFNNNLTALNPFTSAAYPNTVTYQVVPLTVSSTSVTVAASGSTMVTGTDSNASDPMDAESAYGAQDENCNTGGGATLATISPGSLNGTNWTQPFTINAGSTTGTCTFYIYDTDAGTVTLPITVTIN